MNESLPPGKYVAQSFIDALNGNQGMEIVINEFLNDDQVNIVLKWLNQWEQIKDGAIPIRFYESFKGKSKQQIEHELNVTDSFRSQIKNFGF